MIDSRYPISESQTNTDEDYRGVLDMNYYDLSLFQKIQAKSQYVGMSEETFSYQIKESYHLNAQPREDGSSSALEAIRSAIERAKGYPVLARERGMEGTVLVSFAIDRKGLSKDIKIIKSSGYRILDEEVKKILKKASPFPEFNEPGFEIRRFG